MRVPAIAVDGTAHDCEATPDDGSVALGAAAAVAPSATGFGVTAGASVGAVLSTCTSMAAVGERPSRSDMVPVTVIPSVLVSAETVTGSGHVATETPEVHVYEIVTAAVLHSPST